MINLHSQSINVNRLELIKVMKANKEKHVAEYNVAAEAYQGLMIKKLQETIRNIKKGKIKELNVRLAKPVSQEDAYQDVIDVLEVSVDENIQLDKQSFQAFYQDKWIWSESFKLMASSYASGKV